MYHGYLQFFTLELLLRCLQFFCYRGRCSSQLAFSGQSFENNGSHTYVCDSVQTYV